MNQKSSRKRGHISSNVDKIFKIVGNALSTASLLASKKITSGIALFQEIKEKSRDLVTTNLELAEIHLRNNNFFDAKIRYKMILKMDQGNFYALAGLGFIYSIKGNPEKALSYFHASLKNVPDEFTRIEIEKAIHRIERNIYEE